jgi:hypothetical protein
MNDLKINVYDDENNVIKTSEAKLVDLKFGVIRKLMKLLNVDNIDNTVELLKTVYGAWEQITNILNNCFPDMTDDDWDNVKASELLPVFVMILKYSFTQMLTIPTDKEKN